MKLNHRHKPLKDKIVRKRLKTTMYECIKTYLKESARIIFRKRLGFWKRLFEKTKIAQFLVKDLKFFFIGFLLKKKKIFLDKKIVKKNVGFKEKGLEMHFFMRKSFIFPRKWILWFFGNQGFYSLKKKKKIRSKVQKSFILRKMVSIVLLKIMVFI